MNKTGLIIQREYFSRVLKKSFLLTTILTPLVIVGFYALMIYMGVKGGNEKKRVAVIDESQIVSDSLSKESEQQSVKFEIIKNTPAANFVKEYKKAGYDAFLFIPKINIDSPVGIKISSAANLSLATTSAIQSFVNKAVEQRRMQARGINPGDFDKIRSKVSIETALDTEEGQKKSAASVTYIASLACGFLIYLMMMIYGTMVMRGVSEEKINRVSEIIISSVKPFELMMGKVLGIGLVGLTQFVIWLIIGFALNLLMPILFPGVFGQLKETMNGSGANASQVSGMIAAISSLPILKIVLVFLFYFLFGYLLYASLFAAIGSVVSDDQNEAQQLVMPVMMPIIFGFFIMMQALNNPNSGLVVFGSLFPLTSPVVMMGRITYDVPIWQLILSMVLLVGSFLLLTWFASRIYRVGILMYGKKPTWKELLKWASKK